MKRFSPLCVFFLCFAALLSCNKNNEAKPVDTNYKLSYGDSIFYVNSQPANIINPVNAPQGTYYSIPKGLEIDPNTGSINVSSSEAGLRYKVTFTSTTGYSTSSFIVISGIDFPDKYYHLTENDSIAFPVYNASSANAIPAGSFDDDYSANSSGCAMKTTNGQINLTESIRRGLFGSTPKNDTRKDFEIKYRINDKSGNALNKIKVLLYYYDKASDVPADLKQTILDHQSVTFHPDNTPLTGVVGSITTAKPRPPCIVIIAH
jgi:hypothetical protein